MNVLNYRLLNNTIHQSDSFTNSIHMTDCLNFRLLNNTIHQSV